jgi:hypothetical protein
MEWVIGYLSVALLLGLVGQYIAGAKNRSDGEGFILAFLLGPIGLIVLALLPTLPPPVQTPKPKAPRLIGETVECDNCHAVSPAGTRNCPTSGCGWYLLDLPVTAAVLVEPEPVQPEVLRRESDGREVRPCPACAELILADASLCRYCRTACGAIYASAAEEKLRHTEPAVLELTPFRGHLFSTERGVHNAKVPSAVPA